MIPFLINPHALLLALPWRQRDPQTGYWFGLVAGHQQCRNYSGAAIALTTACAPFIPVDGWKS